MIFNSHFIWLIHRTRCQLYSQSDRGTVHAASLHLCCLNGACFAPDVTLKIFKVNSALKNCMFPQLKYCSCELWQFNYSNLKMNCILISVMFCNLYSLPEGKWHRCKSHKPLWQLSLSGPFWFGTSGPEALIQRITNGEKWEAPCCYSSGFTATWLSVCNVTYSLICETACSQKENKLPQNCCSFIEDK